jgi:hypothetical protein
MEELMTPELWVGLIAAIAGPIASVLIAWIKRGGRGGTGSAEK